ncbi:MAG: MFS transporter [Pseudomonadota bacterium]
MIRQLPAQVWKLSACYSLMLSGPAMLFFIAGIIGLQLAPSPEYSTLPVGLSILGVAFNTVPVSLLMRRFGRKHVFVSFAIVGLLASLMASWSLILQNFWLFCLASALIGTTTAAVQQFRFAAIEVVDNTLIPKAASCVLLGGIFAAFIGPEITVQGRMVLDTEYSASFIYLAVVYFVAFVILLTIDNAQTSEQIEPLENSRPLSELLSQPRLVMAILTAAIAYGIMSFIMTATPLSMHNYYGHSLESTKWVIQSHVAAMFLPSLASALLISKMGHYRLIAIGVLAHFLCLALAFSSQTFSAYLIALVLLGIGWNFQFISATLLLPSTYRANERFKVQAVNELIVFSTQAIAALSSGWMLFKLEWHGLLVLSVIPIAILAILLHFKGEWKSRDVLCH